MREFVAPPKSETSLHPAPANRETAAGVSSQSTRPIVPLAPVPYTHLDYDGRPLGIQSLDRVVRPYDGMRFHVH